MPKELYELRTELVRCKTGNEFVEWCYENGIKNSVHNGYMAGVLDAMFWAGKITQEFYTEVYERMGL